MLRTAHPIDLTLAELYEQQLFVPSRLMVDKASWVGMSEVRASLSSAAVHVVLGHPGSGKSFALYEAARTVQAASQLPFLLRCSSALDDDSLVEDTLAAADIESGSVIFVDAVDEVRSVGPDALFDLLARLSANSSVVLACREADYAELAPALVTLPIAWIRSLKPWEIDDEFTFYIQRMADRSGLQADEILEIVGRSRQPAFATRPLFARMLLFVIESLEPRDYGIAAGLTDVSQLYDRYFSGLATRARGDLRARGCVDLAPYPAWVRLGRVAWTSGAVRGDRLSAVAWMNVLAEMGEQSPLCAQDALPFASHGTEFGESFYRLTHYSFFEYLLAVAVWDAIVNDNLRQSHEMLALDLSREVRHFVVGIAMPAARPEMVSRMVDMYRHVPSLGDSPERTLRTRNLLIYFCSRLGAIAGPALGLLAEEETEPFLRSALVWGGCHTGNQQSLSQFDSDYRDPVLRSAYRGYVRYYYGDIEFGSPPPFLDDEPFLPGDMDRTDSILPGRLLAPDYRTVSIERKVVDLSTYLDLRGVRGLPVTSEVLDLARSVAVEAGPLGRHLKDLMETASLES